MKPEKQSIYKTILFIAIVSTCSVYASDELDKIELEEITEYAEEGSDEAQYELGMMYYLGERLVAVDHAEAFRWFSAAAEQGNSDAQFALGEMYTHGEGVARDNAEAVRWFREPAEYGWPSAQHLLGLQYLVGEGVAKDYTEAVRWIRAAAEQGYTKAQYSLGLMYENGQGVEKDRVQAYAWINVAAVWGKLEFRRERARVANSMNRSEITKAQELSLELWKEHGVLPPFYY